MVRTMSQDASSGLKEKLKRNKEIIDDKLREFLPEEMSKEDIEKIVGEPKYDLDSEAINNAIAKPLWDIIGRGGKRWRPYLLLLIVEAMGEDPEDYLEFAILPEIVHNGTLVADDIEDKAEIRRGKPAIYKIYGDDISINLGESMYFIPTAILRRNKQGLSDEKLRKIYDVYSEEMTRVTFGQATDIYWHNLEKGDITEREYFQMCSFKTGCLARMAAKIGAILAGGSESEINKISNFVEKLGIGFQIQDDILDIKSTLNENEKFGKQYGNDIKEGKRTLIVIHTLDEANEEDRKRLLEILKKESESVSKKEVDQAIEIIKKYNSLEYAKNKARSLAEEAWDEVKGIIPEGKAKENLSDFVTFLVERDF